MKEGIKIKLGQNLVMFSSSQPRSQKFICVSGIFSFMFRGEVIIFYYLKCNVSDKMGFLFQQHLSVHNNVQRASVFWRGFQVASCQFLHLVLGCFSVKFPRMRMKHLLFHSSLSPPSRGTELKVLTISTGEKE